MIFDLSRKLFEELNDNLQTSSSTPITHDALKALIEKAVKKCNLVTREEFDAQQAVLLRTRTKLEALEAKVEALEKNQ